MSETQTQKKMVGLGEQTKLMHEMLDADKGAAWKRRRRAALLKKKAQHEKNRAARAALNTEWGSGNKWQTPGAYHTALNALSSGTAG